MLHRQAFSLQEAQHAHSGRLGMQQHAGNLHAYQQHTRSRGAAAQTAPGATSEPHVRKRLHSRLPPSTLQAASAHMQPPRHAPRAPLLSPR